MHRSTPHSAPLPSIPDRELGHGGAGNRRPLALTDCRRRRHLRHVGRRRHQETQLRPDTFAIRDCERLAQRGGGICPQRGPGSLADSIRLPAPTRDGVVEPARNSHREDRTDSASSHIPAAMRAGGEFPNNGTTAQELQLNLSLVGAKENHSLDSTSAATTAMIGAAHQGAPFGDDRGLVDATPPRRKPSTPRPNNADPLHSNAPPNPSAWPPPPGPSSPTAHQPLGS